MRLSGVLNIQHRVYKDDGTFVSNDAALGNPAWIELRIVRSSGSGISDGESQLYLGGGSYASTGELVSTHTGILNYTVFENSKHRLGMVNFATNTSVSGSLILDEWTMQDSDERILVGEPIAHSGTASIAGNGTVQAAGEKTASGTIAISQNGIIEALGLKHIGGEISLSGGGTVSAVGVLITLGSTIIRSNEQIKLSTQVNE